MPEGNLERVLLTGDTVGGVWTFTLDLARVLTARGVQVLVAAMGGEPSAEQRREVDEISNLRLEASNYKVEWMDDPWKDVEASGRWLLNLARRFEPDVIHLNTLAHGALPFNVPVIMTAHSCVASWWAAVKHEPLPGRWNRYRETVRRSIRSVDLLTAPSQSMLRSLSQNYGPGLPPARVVSNGRPASLFRSAEKDRFVLTAGRLWDEGKNVAALAKVARNLPWPVYLAGDECSPGGETASVRGGLPLGRLSQRDLAGWYSRAAIYALPARYEPFGLSILEAALSGCALVLGDIESLQETWADAAVFVPPDDPAMLEGALLALIGCPALREELSLRSLIRARAFTAERMADGYSQIYATLAGTRRTVCSL